MDIHYIELEKDGIVRIYSCNSYFNAIVLFDLVQRGIQGYYNLSIKDFKGQCIRQSSFTKDE